MANNNFSDFSGAGGLFSNRDKYNNFLRDLPKNLRDMGINPKGNSRGTAEKLQEEIFNESKGMTASQFKEKIQKSGLNYNEQQKMLRWFLNEREEENN